MRRSGWADDHFSFRSPILSSTQRNAVRTAIVVQRSVQTVNHQLDEWYESIVVNIGINSGFAAV
ncbi:hypothetical protein C2W62_44710 [Candidatus Entotheonella serta]|nr:hypothetical protein C2W62_44710 [Candidatus Entotheonella serta]